MPPPLRSPFADGYVPPGDVNPDYLYFLQHSYLDEDQNFILELPAEVQSHGASPPPLLVDNEAPPASSHGECASDMSTPNLSTDRESEEKESAVTEETVPVPAPAPVRHWYAGDGVDEDYRIFFQHIRQVDGQLIFENGDCFVNYDQPVTARSGASGEAEKTRGKRRAEEVDSQGGTLDAGGERKGVALGSPATHASDNFEIRGGAVNYDQPGAARSWAYSEAEKKKKGKMRVEEIDSTGGTLGVGGERRKPAALGSPATPVPTHSTCDWQADPKQAQVDEGPSHAATAVTVKKGSGVYWEASSSNGHSGSGDGLPSVSKGKVEKGPGVIWPAHITERPDSDFKRRLIEFLTRPGSRKEYYKLFNMLTLRKPVVKLRQVRNDEKFYQTEEMGSSYLDHYPELADQIMKSGSLHGLALMRGFVFWLQNSCHEDQFMPWAGGSEGPEVIPLVD